MATSSRTPTTGKTPNLATGILMRFGTIVATLAVQALLLFGGAGTLHWSAFPARNWCARHTRQW